MQKQVITNLGNLTFLRYQLSNFLMYTKTDRFFPKALRRVLPENPLNTDTSTLTRTRGAVHVWRYELSWAGDQRIYVCHAPPSTTYHGDIMFIVPGEIAGQVWHMASEVV